MLYGSVEDLLENGMVSEVAAPRGSTSATNDRYRYLALTSLGREALAAETDEYQEVVRIARDLLAKESST